MYMYNLVQWENASFNSKQGKVESLAPESLKSVSSRSVINQHQLPVSWQEHGSLGAGLSISESALDKEFVY